MADKQNIVTLSLGSQRVTMAKFAKAKSGLILQKFGFRHVEADPALPEGARLLQLAQGVKELVQELSVSGESVWFAVTGKTVFLKFFKLPAVSGVPEEQLVKMEAQQNVPFPIDEVVWDYHVQTSISGDKEVFLVAIKKDSLNELDSFVSGTGLKTEGVTPSAVAIYNAFRMSYPDESGPVMLLDIGARNTNVLYVEGNSLFIRNISSGGATVTAQIAKEYNVSFSDAEKNKIAHGLVLLGGGHSTQIDEASAHLGSIIRNSLNRLVTQVAQTTNLYRTQGSASQTIRDGSDASPSSGGSAPAKIYLCGGAAALPYTKEFIEERLHTPVKYLNPMHHVAASKNLDVNEVTSKAYLLTEVVGLAAQATGLPSAASLVLEPERLSVSREAKKRLPFLAAGFAAAIIGAGVFAYSTNKAAEQAEKSASALQANLDDISSLRESIDSRMTDLSRLDSIVQNYKIIVSGRYSMLHIIDEIRQLGATDKIWITDFAPMIGFDSAIKGKLSGTPLILDSYRDIANGNSALAARKAITPPTSRPGQTKPAASVVSQNEINAIRIQGLARLDQGGKQKAITDINDFISKLKKSPKFKFDGLENNQIIAFGDAPEDAYALPFTAIIPLAQPLAIDPEFAKVK